MSNEIEIKAKEIDSIFGKTPPWITRWGISIIFLSFFLIITGSFFFKYPETIKASIIIISENPTASIVSHVNGKLDNLLIQNEKIVKQGEILAILENSANYKHIIDLKNKLDSFSFFFSNQLNQKQINFQKGYSLGQVQSAFSGFQRQYDEYLNFLSVDIISKKITSVKNQNNDYLSYILRLKNQASNQEQSLNLTRKQFLRDSILFQNDVLSIAEYEKSEQTFLQVKNTYQNLLASLANTKMQINILNYQVIDLESQRREQEQSKINSLKESYDNLRAVIAEWEKNYMLISPVEGKITFNRYWNKNQYVTSGETVFIVVPLTSQKVIGRAKLSVLGSGKVAIGQQVLVRVDNFPFMEYGILQGVLVSLSEVPESTQQGVFYTAEIYFPKGLITNYKKNLPFLQEMQGNAEIITQNISLFERLIRPIKSALKKNEIK